MLNRLKKGDKIAIFSPSSPATVWAYQRFQRAKAFIEDKGFIIVEGKLTGKSEVYRSGTPKERAAEFNELLRDSSIKMIMSTIGGTNSNSMLPYLDYEAFKENPKIIVGYSDATAVLLALYAKTGISTFYGPALVPSFGEFEPLVNDTYRYFEQYFVEESQLPYEVPMPPYWSDEPVNWLEKTTEKTLYANEWITGQGGVAEGRLIGGNVNSMYGFIGTHYFPQIKQGDILLIEDCMKDASIVEKNFAMLKLHGVFNKVSGIILGKHEQFNDLGTGKRPLDLLIEQLDGLDIPVLAEFDTCHTHPMHPLAIGRNIKLDADAKKVFCVERWL
ncbi:S66 family peptidase [Ureibacillus acetophenoni]|uniref:Muramoyltetrapeptide carboxypeptidase LdcA involved in peptidoglycan recycling n=1 Tax=Ureibacillus acetophenoni TaxID=614649 RepID=A0A285UM10_9BACL|nr:S66 peptidase family protein [Ureibacillus acetophenoni]SOC42793.1 muramoyltetrapeptide carboxypeptidase LdcA involved in peptidoglycan recycling [Ureibacillus acetophenoni]